MENSHRRNGSIKSVLCMMLAFGASLVYAQAGLIPQGLSPKPNMNNPRFVLPPEIPVIPGREINIYFENVMLFPIDWQKFCHMDVECSKGQQQEERWTYTPKPEEMGVYPLHIRLYDPEDDLLAEASTLIRVYPANAGAGQSISLLIIGDSLTAAMIYTEELYNLMALPDNPKLALIGTNAPFAERPYIRNEGYGGWTAKAFATRWASELHTPDGRRARSPFLFEKNGQPVLDFQLYCDANNGGRGPDFITILLGCNDTFGAKDDTIESSIDDFFRHLDILIQEFHRVRPDTKIGLIPPMPPAASQDAFGANYGCGQTRWQYKKNQHRVLERMYQTYSGRESENIFLIPMYVNLDTVHNYPVIKGPANARSEWEMARQHNGVHPAAAGYRQMADSLYCWLKGMLARL